MVRMVLSLMLNSSVPTSWAVALTSWVLTLNKPHSSLSPFQVPRSMDLFLAITLLPMRIGDARLISGLFSLASLAILSFQWKFLVVPRPTWRHSSPSLKMELFIKSPWKDLVAKLIKKRLLHLSVVMLLQQASRLSKIWKQVVLQRQLKAYKKRLKCFKNSHLKKTAVKLSKI
jgi:hypothetical protein